MKRWLTGAALAACAVMAGRPTSAQVTNGSTRDKLVVSPAWLAEHLNDAGLVVLQVGRRETFGAGHIPGARLVDYDAGALAAPMDQSGKMLALEMPPAAALHDQLAALGVSDTSRIVVVSSDNYWSPSTRVIFTLDYAGLSNVSWLDGGLKAWKDAGRAVSTSETPVKPGTLAPLKLRPLVVDAEFVQAHARTAGFAIVDARSRDFYDGIPMRGGRGGDGAPPPKLGHIPGALSAPFDKFATSAGGGTDLRTAPEIASMLTAAGVKPGDTIIGYCHVGQQATAMLFAARTLGYSVLLYDGSFEDWSKRDLPVENPAAKKEP